MFDSLSSFVAEMICLSVFVGIIQMILPKGKLKQNVLFTCKLVVSLLLLEPIISLLHGDMDIKKIYEANVEEYEISVARQEFEEHYEQMLYEAFEENIKEDIMTRLKRAGYKVNSVACEIDKETYEPKYLKLEIESSDGYIQPVKIEVMGSNSPEEGLSEMQKYQIEKILVENYGIKKENIFLNGG